MKVRTKLDTLITDSKTKSLLLVRFSSNAHCKSQVLILSSGSHLELISTQGLKDLSTLTLHLKSHLSKCTGDLRLDTEKKQSSGIFFHAVLSKIFNNSQ